jgi:hypothetical protein
MLNASSRIRAHSRRMDLSKFSRRALFRGMAFEGLCLEREVLGDDRACRARSRISFSNARQLRSSIAEVSGVPAIAERQPCGDAPHLKLMVATAFLTR